MNEYTNIALNLLSKLISITSFSKEEANTASLLKEFFKLQNINPELIGNNVLVRNRHFSGTKPVLLLNSHHDTVKPNNSWIRNPFLPTLENDILYGLGSNDAGASLVSLISVFLHFYKEENLPFDLMLVASAEEEISGANGIARVLENIKVDFAIVGEPTGMKLAVAEKGLLVLDGKVYGKAGHAAREEGENAIYKSLDILHWFQTYKFDKVSPLLGPVKMAVTVINAGTQHNVVPDVCTFTVDVRTTEMYTNKEVVDIICQQTGIEIKPRSLRLQASGIDPQHPLILAANKSGFEKFGSPTLSDQALMPFPSVKIGPGDSARSHTADEHILLSEIESGIEVYIQYIQHIAEVLHDTKATL